MLKAENRSLKAALFMSITRRIFVRNGALAAIATTALPSFLARAAFGRPIKERAPSAWSSSSNAEPPTA